MSKNLYVGNLSFETTADDLREAFGQHGAVTSAQVIADRGTGRSRGFGFVEMAAGADEAIANLNGAMFQGRTLTVSVRPWNWAPFRLAMASSAPSLISTKPKPRDRPVSRSVAILTDTTSPWLPNSDVSSSFVVV